MLSNASRRIDPAETIEYAQPTRAAATRASSHVTGAKVRIENPDVTARAVEGTTRVPSAKGGNVWSLQNFNEIDPLLAARLR
jgi:hypothetical protein